MNFIGTQNLLHILRWGIAGKNSTFSCICQFWDLCLVLSPWYFSLNAKKCQKNTSNSPMLMFCWGVRCQCRQIKTAAALPTLCPMVKKLINYKNMWYSTCQRIFSKYDHFLILEMTLSPGKSPCTDCTFPNVTKVYLLKMTRFSPMVWGPCTHTLSSCLVLKQNLKVCSEIF